MFDTKGLEYRLIHACQNYPPDFIEIHRILSQGADINAFDPSDPDENVLSGVYYGYPLLFEEDEEPSDIDGRYLPQLTQFFLEHGFDPTLFNGKAGAVALCNLVYSSHDKYILDAAKLLLSAGADPTVLPFSDDDEDVLSIAGADESFHRICERQHHIASMYTAFYEILNAKCKGLNYWLIENYDVCISRRIDSITLYSDNADSQGIFPVSGHQNAYTDTVVIDCGGKALCLSCYADLWVDPHIPQRAVYGLDLSPLFSDCIGHVLVSVSFDHRTIEKGTTHYVQPLILLHLDNGKIMRFSINHGEVPQDEMSAWFDVL